ncbi:MAG: type II toxin-antitoxin system VapC family toxin [Bifidobacteriaceae bacterium]|jgi:predicted nucleic acid-binding protein|nr:type II toxin-antitoxin system VapC family toxin [Bifidobacteriaceae bacterium]
MATIYVSSALPTNVDHLLMDTSAALALVHRANPFHPWVEDVVAGRMVGLAGHAYIETYSVLTRLPSTARVSPGNAVRLIASQFPASRFLEPHQYGTILEDLRDLGVGGGAVYDALVAACARAHGLPLVTCDLRARSTYRLLGTEVLAPPAGIPRQ